jgi:hypothetical protein
MVRKGTLAVDPATFDISTWYGPSGRRLVNGLPPAASTPA